jgi:hypothetical protein
MQQLALTPNGRCQKEQTEASLVGALFSDSRTKSSADGAAPDAANDRLRDSVWCEDLQQHVSEAEQLARLFVNPPTPEESKSDTDIRDGSVAERANRGPCLVVEQSTTSSARRTRRDTNVVMW